MSPHRESIRETRLDAALEDRLAGRTPPDLSGAILDAAGLEPESTSRPSRFPWWKAALVLLGLGVLPAIYLLQRPAAPGDTPAVERQDPVEPALEERERVTPENREQLLELLARAQSVSVMVENVYGLPREVAGEAPARPIPLYGEGARRELGWAARADQELAAGLDTVRTGMAGLRAVRTAHFAARNLDVRVGLPDGRELALAVGLMGGTANGLPRGARVQHTNNDVVWVTAGELRLEIDEPAVRQFWVSVDELATRTHQFDRGIYYGDDLARLASAKRSPRLRLHEANTGHLQSLGGSTACRHLDLRYSWVGGAYAIENLPNLETLWLAPTHVGDIREASLPSLRELAFASGDEHPHRSISPGAAKIRAREGSPPLFAAFPGLVRLYAPGVGATDRDLEALPATLETVVLRYRREDGGRSISDRGIAALAALPRLRHVDLGFVRHGLNADPQSPSLAAVEALTGVAPLRHLVLDGWFANLPQAQADDPGERARILSKIGTLPQLQHLSLRDNRDLTGTDLEALGFPPSLRVLDLRGCAIERSALRRFAQTMPQCRVLPNALGPGVAMHPVVEENDARFDMEEEQRRLSTWLSTPAEAVEVVKMLGETAASPGITNQQLATREPQHLGAYNILPRDRGGPHRDLLWASRIRPPSENGRGGWEFSLSPPFHRTIGSLAFVALDRTEGFDGESLRATAEPQQTQHGWRVLYEVRGEDDYAAFTRRHLKRCVPITLDARVIASPTIVAPILDNAGVIDCGERETAWAIYRALR